MENPQNVRGGDSSEMKHRGEDGESVPDEEGGHRQFLVSEGNRTVFLLA